MTLMIDPRNKWKVIYIARSNRFHPPMLPNSVLATKNNIPNSERNWLKRLKCHLQWRTIRPWSEDDSTMIRAWLQAWNCKTEPVRSQSLLFPPRQRHALNYNISRSGYLPKFHQILRLPRKMSLQQYQTLHLPREVRCEWWDWCEWCVDWCEWCVDRCEWWVSYSPLSYSTLSYSTLSYWATLSYSELLNQSELLSYSTELSLGWTVPWLNCYLPERFLDWTVTWVNCSLTELFLDWTGPWLKCYLTELLLDCTVPWLNCYLTEPLLFWTLCIFKSP